MNDINNEVKLDYILRDLKMQITDLWKEKNVVNLSTPLILTIKSICTIVALLLIIYE